jgi:hypothetical protein
VTARNDPENPYRPPLSASSPEPPSRRIGWKVYQALLALSYVFGYVLTGVQWIQPFDVVDMIVTLVAMVGLFGFAYRRRLANAVFWRRWLPIQVAWDIVVVVFLAQIGLAHQVPGAGERSATFDLTVQLVFLLPLYIALFRYGFRSPELWDHA